MALALTRSMLKKYLNPLFDFIQSPNMKEAGLVFPSVKKLQAITRESYMQKEPKMKDHDLH